MKCQILFSGENKKNISKCHVLKFVSSMLSVDNSIDITCIIQFSSDQSSLLFLNHHHYNHTQVIASSVIICSNPICKPTKTRSNHHKNS